MAPTVPVINEPKPVPNNKNPVNNAGHQSLINLNTDCTFSLFFGLLNHLKNFPTTADNIKVLRKPHILSHKLLTGCIIFSPTFFTPSNIFDSIFFSLEDLSTFSPLFLASFTACFSPFCCPNKRFLIDSVVPAIELRIFFKPSAIGDVFTSSSAG